MAQLICPSPSTAAQEICTLPCIIGSIFISTLPRYLPKYRPGWEDCELICVWSSGISMGIISHLRDDRRADGADPFACQGKVLFILAACNRVSHAFYIIETVIAIACAAQTDQS